MGEMKSRTRGLEKRAASSCPVWLCPCPDTPEITPSTLRSRDTENKGFVFSFLLCSSLHFQAPKAGSALLGQVRNQFLKKAEQKISYNVAAGGWCFQKNKKTNDSWTTNKLKILEVVFRAIPHYSSHCSCLGTPQAEHHRNLQNFFLMNWNKRVDAAVKEVGRGEWAVWTWLYFGIWSREWSRTHCAKWGKGRWNILILKFAIRP